MIIWLASYPRSGNTFLRIILNKLFGMPSYSIYNDKADIDADTRTSEVVGHRLLRDDFDIADARQSGEIYIIKTHELPDRHYESGDKVIYLIRDGRASSLSLVNHQRHFGRSMTTLADVISGNVFGGLWGDHVASWSPATRPDCLLIRFENLISPDEKLLGALSEFLNSDRSNNDLPSFQELHEVNPKFFSTGKTDAWKQIFTPEEHMLFWLNNCKQMKAYGYTDDMPDIFENENDTLLFRALSYENRHIINVLSNLGNTLSADERQAYTRINSNLAKLRDTSALQSRKIDSLIDELAGCQKNLTDQFTRDMSTLDLSLKNLGQQIISARQVQRSMEHELSRTNDRLTAMINSDRRAQQNKQANMNQITRQPTMQFSLQTLRESGVFISSVLDVGVLAVTQPLIDVYSDKHHHLFEPVDTHFDAIRRNYKDIHHTLHKVALSDKDGELFLACTSINNDGVITHSRVMERQVSRAEVPNLVSCERIRQARLDTVLKEAPATPPYLLKIDVDGHEINVLKGADETLKNTSIIVIEAPLDRSALPKFFERGMYLLERGFRLMDIVDLSYYHGVLWQCDLVFVHKDIVDSIDRLRPFQASTFSFEPGKWYALNHGKFV